MPAASPRPLTVTVLGLIYILVGAGGFVAHFGELRSGNVLSFDGIGIELLEVLAIVAGAFLLRARNWARWLTIAWMAIHVGISVLNTWSEVAIHSVFLILIVWLLFRRDAAIYFRRTAGG
jgi:hypothetical protein